MEHRLRCNALDCRQELNDHAVVTTCSHIFCIDCSNRSQLSGQRGNRHLRCPACSMQLKNPDDVVVANLNPTEDYKTSVLSGQSPNAIIECAGRALSFWAYQSNQEIFYHVHEAKKLFETCTSLKVLMENNAHDSSSQILDLETEISNLKLDQNNLRHKNEELMQAIKEKSRKQLQTQELYDKLKRRVILGEVQPVASDAVDNTNQASVTANRFIDRISDQTQQPPQHPLFPRFQHSSAQNPNTAANDGMIMGPPINSTSGRGDGSRTGFNSQGNTYQSTPIQTPSAHREYRPSGNGPSPRIGLANLQLNGISNIPIPQRSSPRQPLASLNGNTAAGSGFAGYGMSAGLKVSNPTAAVAASGIPRPAMGSRAAQRPGSGYSLNRNHSFRPFPVTNISSNGNGHY